MKNLGLIVNFTKPAAKVALKQLVNAAEALGLTLFAERKIEILDARIQPLPRGWKEPLEAVISLGGDGSFLTAAHTLNGTNLPLIGFNIGTFGYLTAVNEDGFLEALTALKNNDIQIESRSTLTASVEILNANPFLMRNALNDVVISRADSGHAVTLELSLNGTFLSCYTCDGILISTPTGSTAYSLAIGGPIVLPGTNALVIGIISPHVLSSRPLVIPASTEVAIRVISDDALCHVYSDGQQCVKLKTGDRVVIKQSEQSVPMIIPNGEDSFTILSKKLGWGNKFTR